MRTQIALQAIFVASLLGSTISAVAKPVSLAAQSRAVSCTTAGPCRTICKIGETEHLPNPQILLPPPPTITATLIPPSRWSVAKQPGTERRVRIKSW
jgi:hypothetical protein